MYFLSSGVKGLTGRLRPYDMICCRQTFQLRWNTWKRHWRQFLRYGINETVVWPPQHATHATILVDIFGQFSAEFMKYSLPSTFPLLPTPPPSPPLPVFFRSVRLFRRISSFSLPISARWVCPIWLVQWCSHWLTMRMFLCYQRPPWNGNTSENLFTPRVARIFAWCGHTRMSKCSTAEPSCWRLWKLRKPHWEAQRS